MLLPFEENVADILVDDLDVPQREEEGEDVVEHFSGVLEEVCGSFSSHFGGDDFSVVEELEDVQYEADHDQDALVEAVLVEGARGIFGGEEEEEVSEGEEDLGGVLDPVREGFEELGVEGEEDEGDQGAADIEQDEESFEAFGCDGACDEEDAGFDEGEDEGLVEVEHVEGEVVVFFDGLLGLAVGDKEGEVAEEVNDDD